MATIYKPGDEVPNSGIYKVIHDPNHAKAHEVTAIVGEHFPPCNHCGHPLVQADARAWEWFREYRDLCVANY